LGAVACADCNGKISEADRDYPCRKTSFERQEGVHRSDFAAFDRVTGNPGGSLEATRRSFNKDFLLALKEHFDREGPKVIARVARDQPAAYMKICALLVPREMKVEHGGGIKAMSTEQIERGIELIKEMIAKRDAAASAKVIEGEAVEQKPKRKRGEKVGALSPRILDIASKPTDQGAT